MDTGLTTISEADIEKHRPTAQSMITRGRRAGEDLSGSSNTALAGMPAAASCRRSRPARRRTREVELAKTVGAMRPDDQLMGIAQHTLLFRARRGLAIALAVSEVFARANDLESLAAKNARAPLEGDEATRFKKLLSASAYVSAFTFASYLLRQIDGDGEAPNDIKGLPVRHAAGCAEVADRRPRRCARRLHRRR